MKKKRRIRRHFYADGQWRMIHTGFAVLCLASAILAPATAGAQGARPSEYQVKAAYLYDFSRFVAWPAQSGNEKSGEFAICVLGEDPFGTILDTTVTGEKSGGQAVVTRRISKPQDALNCRILFIGDSETDHLKEVLAEMGRASVLTVSDIPRFSERGGMIEFILKGNKVRFNVNLTNATDAGLTVSSELLKVALTVRRNPSPGD